MVAAIRTAGLAKSFGATAALQPLDLEVAEGEVLGYLGPNGAGKTTTIRCLLGMVRASAGFAEIFGHVRRSRPRAAVADDEDELLVLPRFVNRIGPSLQFAEVDPFEFLFEPAECALRS